MSGRRCLCCHEFQVANDANVGEEGDDEDTVDHDGRHAHPLVEPLGVGHVGDLPIQGARLGPGVGLMLETFQEDLLRRIFP